MKKLQFPLITRNFPNRLFNSAAKSISSNPYLNLSKKCELELEQEIWRMNRRCISFQRNTKDKLPERPWREAASLLIVAPMNNCPPYSLGYLMTKRSKGSRLYPGGTVFPGGAVSPSVDFSPHWIDLYNSANIDLTTLQFLKQGAHIPYIYENKVEETETNRISKILSSSNYRDELPFSKQVALRLTAIRETFEEVGILVCKRKPGHVLISGHAYEYDELSDRKQVQMWQKKISKKPDEFIKLCEKLNCLPDLGALSEWSNWLTPAIFKPKSRFDAIFYMVVLPKMLRVVYNTNEIDGAQWAQPSSLLREQISGDLKLMPPQLYELNRLRNVTTVLQLQDRLKSRMERGIERYFPVIKLANDGQLVLLPGDELYPESPDFLTLTKVNQNKMKSTLSELKQKDSKLHRSELRVKGAYETIVNVTRHGQVY